jgi:serine/threonine protein phosphatase PrpC/lipoprotein NlpI
MDSDKTVFISYRRDVSAFIARAIFMDLRTHGYDVFLDIESINSGDFETIILKQITARTHFLPILTFGTLDRCQDPSDWVRREIETAMNTKRNIVPLLIGDFRFKDVQTFLIGQLEQLPRYNGLEVPHTFFEAAMNRLRERFLTITSEIPIIAPSDEENMIVQEKIEELANQPEPTVVELEAESHMISGIRALQENNQDEALNQFNLAIERNPKYHKAYYNRGLLYKKAEKYTEALKDYNHALRLDANYVKGYINRGIVFSMIGQVDVAIADFSFGLDLQPENIGAIYNRGLAYFSQNQLQKAKADFEEFLRLAEPDNTQRDIIQKHLDSIVTKKSSQVTYRPKYSVRLRSSARSDRGRVRQNNEDSVHLWSSEYHVLAVVADGMGGAVAGTEAGLITVETIQEKLKSGEYRKPGDYQDYDSDKLGELLRESVKDANRNIMARATAAPELKGMGTTVTMAFARGSEVIIVHVGESRAYYIDGDTHEIEQLTTDHTFVQALVDAGHLKPEEAKGHSMQNVLYRALGQGEELDVDLIPNITIHLGDRLVLCSDGLTRHVDANEIADIALDTNDPNQIGDKLIELANSRGGNDNISVIVVVVTESETNLPSISDVLNQLIDDEPTVPINPEFPNLDRR